MKQFIQKMLLDESDSPSTKRVIALIGSVILFLTTFINSFSEVGYAPSAELIAGCVTIICVCLGASTVDKFSPKHEN